MVCEGVYFANSSFGIVKLEEKVRHQCCHAKIRAGYSMSPNLSVPYAGTGQGKDFTNISSQKYSGKTAPFIII